MVLRIMVIFMALLFVVSAGYAQGIKKGLWEITTETVMEGMPVKIPPMTAQSCVTSEKYLPTEPEKNTNCKMIYSKQEGNRVSWKAVCKEKDSNVESTGTMTYGGNTFTSVVDSVMTGGGETVKTKTTMKGNYLGPCK